MGTLSCNNISIHAGSFGLKNINFGVNEGDYFVLLGPSGAGKSLLLETIAGFLQPSFGNISLDGEDITNETPQRRQVGLLFQDYALFPHLTVIANIRYPLKGLKLTAAEKKHRIDNISQELGIGHLLHRYPENLSGGEKQRVALARILVCKPSVLLLDEPLSSLDVQLRSSVRSMLRQLNRQGQTILQVTHDYEEARILANRVAIIENNTIVQCGSPDEVFLHPRSAFVANFVGIRNFFKGWLSPSDLQTKPFKTDNVILHVMTDQPAGSGFVVVRSEDIILSLHPLESTAANSLPGIVKSKEQARIGYEVVVDAGITLVATVTSDSVSRLNLIQGQQVYCGFKASAVHFISE